MYDNLDRPCEDNLSEITSICRDIRTLFKRYVEFVEKAHAEEASRERSSEGYRQNLPPHPHYHQGHAQPDWFARGSQAEWDPYHGIEYEETGVEITW